MADQSNYPGMPGWVKVFGIIALVVVWDTYRDAVRAVPVPRGQRVKRG